MNALSIALYIADIVYNIASFFFVAGMVLLILVVIINLIHNVGSDDLKIYGVKYIVVGIFVLFMSAITPSKDTVYMIAASEIGETVITSPENAETLSKIRKVVDTKLDAIIAGSK